MEIASVENIYNSVSEWFGLALAVGLVVLLLVLVLCKKLENSDFYKIILTTLAATLIIYFPSLESIRFGKLEATLQDRIVVADTTISQLRSIAVFSIKESLKFAFTSISKPGDNRRNAFALRDEAIKQLKEIGASSAQVDEALSIFNKLVAEHYVMDISNGILEDMEKNQPLMSRYDEEFNRIFPDSNINPPDPIKWQSFAEQYKPLKSRIKDLFEDYKSFLKTGDLLRPEIFFSSKYN